MKSKYALALAVLVVIASSAFADGVKAVEPSTNLDKASKKGQLVSPYICSTCPGGTCYRGGQCVPPLKPEPNIPARRQTVTV